MMDFQKLNGTRIPLTQKHIDATQAVFHESNHPVTKAIQATLGEDFTVLIYLLQEQIAIFQKNRDKINRCVAFQSCRRRTCPRRASDHLHTR